VATLPAAHDPDSFTKKFGPAALKELIEKAEGFFDYYLNRLCTTNDTASDKGRLAVLRRMGEAVHKTANGVLIDKYAQKTALRLGVAPDAVRAEFRKLSRGKAHPRQQPIDEVAEESAAQPSAPMPMTELKLLRIMLAHEDFVPWVAQRIDFAWLQHPLARRILEARIAAQKDNSWNGLAGFLDRFEDEETRNFITQAATDPKKMEDPEKTLRGDPSHSDKGGILERLRDEFLDRQLAALQQRTNNPATNDSELPELLKQQQELRSLKRKPVVPP